MLRLYFNRFKTLFLAFNKNSNIITFSIQLKKIKTNHLKSESKLHLVLN